MFKEYCCGNEKIIVNISEVVYVDLYKSSNGMYVLELYLGYSNNSVIYEDDDITNLNCVYEEIKKDLFS